MTLVCAADGYFTSRQEGWGSSMKSAGTLVNLPRRNHIASIQHNNTICPPVPVFQVQNIQGKILELLVLGVVSYLTLNHLVVSVCTELVLILNFPTLFHFTLFIHHENRI